MPGPTGSGDADIAVRRFTGDVASLPRPKMYRLKVISMGSEAVGKSCIIKRFCEERFVPKYLTTIGIDYGVKPVTINGAEVRVNFWDLSGAPDFLETRNEFYRDAQAAILVYDVTNPRSFAQLDHWLAEAATHGAVSVPTVVCANKCDQPKRLVTEAEGRRWATAKGFPYFDVSAQSGQNVNAVFDQLFNVAFAKAYGS
jgi:DnaJ family protein C protein 27